MKRALIILLVGLMGFAGIAGIAACSSPDPGSVDAGDHDTGDQDTGDQDAGDTGESDTDTGGTGDAGENGENGPDPLACPPLSEPQGQIVEVTQDNLADLPHLVRTADPDTHFVFEPGTYDLPNTLHVRAPGLSFRSSTGDANDVVLDGRYEVNSLFLVNASDVTIAHLTLTRAVHHAVHVSPEGDATEDVVGTDLYGLRIFDISQQFVKVNSNGARTAFVDDGRLECSYFELTDAGRPNVDPTATGCYTGGIDAHSSRGWLIRNNDFIDIYCDGAGLAEHAVHFWSASRDTLVENNRIIGCARGVGFGLSESGNVRDYDDDPYPEVEGYIGHYDGLIRNNIIFADHEWYDTGIELAQARGARVYHNTIYTPEATGAFSSIDYRFPNTDAVIRNNLTDRISVRNGASATVDHNLEGIGPELFVDVTALNFRLVATATDAIDQGVEVDDAGIDIDGNPRNAGEAPDIGAHEFID